MIRRWGRYVGIAYRPGIQLPFTIAWAVGLTALFAAVTGAVTRWRPDPGLVVTVVTLVLFMLLMRALDDVRDLEYDSRVNPGRPLPSGLVRLPDLVTMAAAAAAVVLLLNAGRGVVALLLLALLAYTGAVVAAEVRFGWPSGDRLGLTLAVNLPIQALLSLYVYAGFLQAHELPPSATGLVAIGAVTISALCLELGRKATRLPRAGERTYVSVLGPQGTSFAALAAAVAATCVVLVQLAPWQPGAAWGWVVLLPLALPGVAVARFSRGGDRWPLLPTLAYVPAMYASFVVLVLMTKGVSM